MKRVYVLIVNWNGWMDTIECLESVYRLDYPDYRVVVCDNGSTDDSLARIADWAEGHAIIPTAIKQSPLRDLINPPVVKPISCTFYNRSQAEEGGDCTLDSCLTLIQIDDNLGFAGGNNVGLRHIQARGGFDCVWLLNNDTAVDPNSLKALVARMDETPAVGMCGSTLALYDDPSRVQARGGGWYCKWIGLPWHIGRLQKIGTPPKRKRVEKWMNYVVGASMLVSRDFLINVGLMCEDYFLYFEETDWAHRAGSNFTLAYAPESIVYHKIGRSIGTSSNPRRKSILCDYYGIKNRLLFTRRYYPEALPTVYLSVGVALLLRLALGRVDLASTIWKLLVGRDFLPPNHERAS